MVFTDFLRKIRTSKKDEVEEEKEPFLNVPSESDTSESDSDTPGSVTETDKFIKHTKTSTKTKFEIISKFITFIKHMKANTETRLSLKYIARVVVILVLAAIIVVAMDLVLTGSHGEEMSVGCIKFPVPANARVKLNYVANGILEDFNVSCNEGYLLEGNQTVVCQSDGTWSQIPVCKPVDCGDPRDIGNGVIEDLGNTTYNNTFLVECKDGYYLREGNGTVKCEANGKWDEIPECAPVSCGLPNEPNHTTIKHIEGTVFKKSVSFECIEGFEIQGDSTITCQSNGKWSPFPVCEPVNCGYPSRHIYNGRIQHIEGTVFKKSVSFECIEGFEIQGDSTITCQSNGKWSPFPVCKPVNCGNPSRHIYNGRIQHLIETTYNSTFVVQCNYGYVLKGNGRVKCESNGKWDAYPLCALVSCGSPRTPYNAYEISRSGITFRESVVFNCQAGFRMNGISRVTCSSNGHWTVYPECEYISDPCYQDPCYYGSCVATGSSYICTSAHASGNAGIFCETISKKFSVLFITFLMIQLLKV